MNEPWSVGEVKEGVLSAPPVHNTIPGGERRHVTLHLYPDDAVEYLLSPFMNLCSRLLIECDRRVHDFLHVIFGLELIEVLMCDHLVVRIGGNRMLVRRYPKHRISGRPCGKVNAAGDFWDANHRLDNYVRSHVLP